MKLTEFISEKGQELIVAAITAAEKRTSGEICVHVMPRCMGDVMKMAEKKFNKLGLYKTARRNAVLILVAFKSKKFAIIGDSGINEVVPDNFWEQEKETLVGYLKKDQPVEGLCEIIGQIGESLAQYFPCEKDDVDEISNEVTFSEK